MLDGALPRVVWLLRCNAEEGDRGTSRAANALDPALSPALPLPGRGRTYPALVPAPPRDAPCELLLKRLVSEAGRYDRGVEEDEVVTGAPLPRAAGGSAPTRDGLKGICVQKDTAAANRGDKKVYRSDTAAAATTRDTKAPRGNTTS